MADFSQSLDSIAAKKYGVVASTKPHMEKVTPMTTLNQMLRMDPETMVDTWAPKSNHPSSFDLQKILNDPSKKVDAQLVECDAMGRYRLASYDKESLARRLDTAPIILSSPERPLTLREAMREKFRFRNLREGTFDLDMPETMSNEPFANFTPLFMGPYFRNQFMYKMLEAKSKCYEAWVNNPVAHRIPSLITQFTLGKGVTAHCKDPKTQKVWDDFARLNKLGTSMNVGLTRAGSRLRTWSNQLSVDGELMLQFQPKKDGLHVKCLDSATILDIVSDPEDIEKIHYYHQQFTTRFQQFVKDGTPSIAYIIRQIPGDQVLHIKLNTYENEMRGRSDLYSVIGWLKRLKDLVNANVIKAYFHACFTFDMEVNGDPTTVANIANGMRGQVPTPGATYVHNTNIKRTILPPGATGAGSDSDMLGLMNLISLGTGVPPAYLIGTMAANRAGVLTETEPSTKFFFERQSIWDEALHAMFDRLRKWHYETTGEELSDEIEFSFPVINAVDRNVYLQSLSTMAQNKWFTTKRCAELAAKEWNATSYTYDGELKDIDKEQETAIQRELKIQQIKSQAQSKLMLWQSVLGENQKEEEKKALGFSPTEEQGNMQGQQAQMGGQPAGKPAAGGAKKPVSPVQRAAAKQTAGAPKKAQRATSGGMTTNERTQTAKAVQSKGHD